MNRGDLAFSNLRDSSSPLIPLIFIPSALANYSLKHTLIRHGNRWHFQISPEISLKTIAFAYFHADNTFSFRGVPHLQHLCKEGSRHQDHSHQAHTKHFITVMRKYFVTKNCAMGSGPSEQIVMKCKSKSWLSIQLVHLSNRTIEIYCAVASSIQKIHHYQSIHVCQCANVG